MHRLVDKADLVKLKEESSMILLSYPKLNWCLIDSFHSVWIFLSSGIGVPGLGSFLSFPVIRLECKGRTGYPTYNPTLGRLLGLQAFPRLIFSLLHLVDI